MPKQKKELRVTVAYRPVTIGKIVQENGIEETIGVHTTLYGGLVGEVNWTATNPDDFSFVSGPEIFCTIQGPGIDPDQYDFHIGFSSKTKKLEVAAFTTMDSSPLKVKRSGDDVSFEYYPDFKPIAAAIESYRPTKKEHARLTTVFRKAADAEVRADQKALEYFSNLLKTILEAAGYIIVEVEEHYFPSPTSMALVAPVFSMGLSKTANPIDIQEGYEETNIVYLSRKKPQSKTQVQLKIFDSIPEERMKELHRGFKDTLSSYGLKCLYLAIEECGRNRRNPWFVLDTNRCLDLMGYNRDKKGRHYSKWKKRLRVEFESLTQINFNIERREPKGKGKNKDKVLKFTAPLLSITEKFEEWEVDSGKPIESGKLIKENMRIFLHQEIYKYMDSWYTAIPKSFLTIDARRRPHAILLYSYIANQWRIGWSQYQGTIKQSMRQLLDGAGLLAGLGKKRANQQRDFVAKIIADLKWLKSQKLYWIKSVRVDSRNKPFLEETVTITMSDDHPLKKSMKRISKE